MPKCKDKKKSASKTCKTVVSIRYLKLCGKDSGNASMCPFHIKKLESYRLNINANVWPSSSPEWNPQIKSRIINKS